MKRRLLALSFLLLTFGALLWGSKVTESLLDQHLPGLLTEQLGIPVSLAPTSVNLLALRVSSDHLRMGEPDKLAIDASKVTVSLAWKSLLRGEVRLYYAHAEDLMVNISLWPSSPGPWPVNYQYLDPWLPTALDLDQGHYIAANGDIYPLQQAAWRRTPGQAAKLDWLEKRAAGSFHLGLELPSLPELLALQQLRLKAHALGPGMSQGDISLTLQLDPIDQGYTLRSQASVLGTPIRIEAQSSQDWAFPQQSSITLDDFTPKQFFARLKALVPGDEETNIEAFLARSIPQLELPAHRAELSIGKFHIGQLYAKENRAAFVTGSGGITIEDIYSHGPAGAFSGALSLQHGKDKNWRFNAQGLVSARHENGSIAEQLLDTEWHWQQGKADISGLGGTWGELVDSLHGNLELSGSHETDVATPISLTATLGHRDDLFSLEHILVKLGDASITGRIEFPGDVERKIVLDLTGDALDLRFLFAGELEQPEAGVPIPDYLGKYPEIELDWKLEISGLRLPSLTLPKMTLGLVRSPEGGTLRATGAGPSYGSLDLSLEWQVDPGEMTDVSLDLNMTDIDLEHLYTGRKGLFNTRSSGTLALQSQGQNIDAIFQAMRGQAALQTGLRQDDNWAREPKPVEQFDFSGDAELVLNDRQIIGVRVNSSISHH